jgi:hypothetical protein
MAMDIRYLQHSPVPPFTTHEPPPPAFPTHIDSLPGALKLGLKGRVKGQTCAEA